MLQASVIIPTYKRPQFLLDTIASIMNQKIEGQFEIIAVDNFPDSELCKQVNDLNNKAGGDPVIRYIAEPLVGLHFARHAGARSANAELIVFCDDDIFVKEDWLNSLLAPFKNSEVVCVGGKNLPHWETPPPPWIRFVPQGYYSLLDYGDDQHIMKLDEWFNGCNFAIRKKILFDLGGFNPDGFGDRKLIWHRGDGEYGLMKKIKAKDYQAVYAPGAVIEHRIPSERMKVEYIFHRAFNFGIEASYAFYRYNKPSQLGLFFHIPRLMAGYLKCQLLIVKDKNQEENLFRYHLRKEAYRGNLLHTFRLLTQADLRHFCQHDNYLEEPC